MMIGQICAHIHNYFETDDSTGKRLIYPGTYTIENGSIVLPFLDDGQYFRVIGSKFNDAVHLYGTDELTDETFTGVIWEMRPPVDFIALVAEISSWVNQYGASANSPFQSENVIGVYSYSKDDGGGSWQQVFKQRLNQYRRLY